MACSGTRFLTSMSKNAGEKVPVAERIHWRLIYPSDVQIHSLLLLIAAVIFSNGVHGDLTFDDHLAIQRNADAWANRRSLGSIFYNDFWGKLLDSATSNRSYRPFTVLTFRIQHWLMGYHHSPAFLHSFNYTIAYLNVCLVFYLARLYVYVMVPSAVLSAERTKIPHFTALLTSPLSAVPLMAALLFLVHPVHVEAVTSIVGRCELLYCFFGLIGFFCTHMYLNQVDATADTASATAADTTASAGTKALAPALKHSNKVHGRRIENSLVEQRTLTARYIFFAACALTSGILCKDSGITFIAIYSVHACVMYACGRCQGRRSLLVIAVAVLELVGYIAFRQQFIGSIDLGKNILLRQTENPHYFVPKGLFHWLSMRWVIQVKNLELLFFPTSLCCEYSFNCIPHMHSMNDPRVPYFITVTGCFVITLLGILYGTFVSRSRVALACFVGLLWMAISYAPVSHLFLTVGTFIAERCLYVPSIGAVLLITFIVASPGLCKGVVTRYFYALLLLCVGWGVFSHRRNEDWLTDERLFRSALRVCPTSGKAHSQLATLVSNRERGVTPEVLYLAQRSVALDSEIRDGYYYLALNALLSANDTSKAHTYLRLCMESPFSSSLCTDMYESVTRTLFPNMTDVDRLVDFASLMKLESQKATYLRHAGAISLERENKPCLAQQFFDKAMMYWNNSKVYWFSDEVERMPNGTTYCNTLYWYEQSMLLCDAQNAAGTAERQVAEDRENDVAENTVISSSKASRKRVFLTPREATQRAVDIAERFRGCDTDWRQVLSGPTYILHTIPNRILEYHTLGEETEKILHHYMNYTEVDTPERSEALLMLLDIIVRHYCHFYTLMNDGHVRETVRRKFESSMQLVEVGFPTFHQRLLADVLSVQRALNITTLNATQQHTLKGIVSMASCSPGFSFLSV
ncbi:hypothetical protein, unknown function [Leishmania tarentolae]|uniref:DUF1736 domain-containing protein n=1 Tax=Leishmania tarentolae TaxID=5689 RepID=A0A640KF49_LEITA|nr:hypothetical protein, unknown function [Leishmania tarentolae]